MAWVTPIIHAVGDILTASDWNITSGDLTFLSSVTGATLAGSQNTTSTSYADLGTVGPAVTVTTGANAIVSVSAYMNQNTTPDFAFMGFAVSGATTLAANDQAAAGYQQTTSTGNGVTLSATMNVALTAGSNTFTAKYKAGTAGTATFSARYIVVWPLP